MLDAAPLFEPAPYFSDVSRGPGNGHAVWLHASDGVRLRMGVWPKEDARGTILIFPGRTEYVEKYSDAAREFADRGYASIAMDWRGQGIADRDHSDTKLGHVGHFDEYQRDVLAMLDAVRALDLPKPYYLFAHSMGGCIGLRALHEGLPVRAAAFSAPMWGLHLPIRLMASAWVGSSLARAVGLTKFYAPGTEADAEPAKQPFAQNRLTSDADMYAWMQDQVKAHPEMLIGGPSLGWLNAALWEMLHLTRLPAPNIPTACWLGSEEDIVSSDAIHIRIGSWPKGTLYEVEGAKHEVAMEAPATRSDLFDKAAELFAAH